MDPSKYEEIRNRTLLFFVEKLLESPKQCRTLHDLSCQFGSKTFTREMRQIVGGSQSGLKKFLAQYPSIFKLDEDTVQYFNSSVNTLVPSDDKNARNYAKEAVEYFRQRLILYGVGVRVPIRSLLGHRSQAPAEIRHVSGQHYKEFSDFLEKYPDVFIVDKETVALKEFEGCELRSLKSFGEDGKDSHNYFLLPNKMVDQSKVLNLIDFYGKCIRERGPMLVEQIFHATAIHFQESLFHSPTDLQCFIKLYPQCFQVQSNMVSLADSYSQGLEYMKDRLQRCSSNLNTNDDNESQQRNTNNESCGKVDLTAVERGSQSAGANGVDPEAVNNNTSKNNDNNVNNSYASNEPTSPKSPSITPATQCGNQTLKSRVSNILLKALQDNTEIDYAQNRSFPRRKSEETFVSCIKNKDELQFYIDSHAFVITNLKKCESIVKEILENDVHVGLDCEGVNLGKDGELTLIQVARNNNVVYIFDVLTQPKMAQKLKALLESEKVSKVIHDCRNDSVCLNKQFEITLRNVFDTQSAHLTLLSVNKEEKLRNASLNHLCSIYCSDLCNPFKDKMKRIYRGNNKFWSRRPLTKQMISYAACDVMCLVPHLYDVMKEKMEQLDDSSKTLFQSLCEEQILTHIYPEQVKAKKRLYKNELDLKGLREKLDNCEDSHLVLSNREIRLLKHMELSESDKEKLRSSLKVAKKLDRLEAMLKDEDEDEEQQSSLDSVNDDKKSSSSGGNDGEGEPKRKQKSELERRLEHINQLETIINNLVNNQLGGSNGCVSDSNDMKELFSSESEALQDAYTLCGVKRDFETISDKGSDNFSQSEYLSSSCDEIKQKVTKEISKRGMVSQATQTISTGDVVMTKYFTGSDSNEEI